MAQYNSVYTGEQIDSAVHDIQNIVNIIYPIGSIYMSVNNVSPEVFLGGHWDRIEDTFLLAAGSNHVAAETGGSEETSHHHNMWHSHNVTAAGTNTGTALTVNQMPKHSHVVYVWDNAGTKGQAYIYNDDGTTTKQSSGRIYNDSASSWGSTAATLQAAGSGRGDPSGSVSVKGGNATHTHTFNGSQVRSSEPLKDDGTRKEYTESVTINNMPPYLAVYMWKRVG